MLHKIVLSIGAAGRQPSRCSSRLSILAILCLGAILMLPSRGAAQTAPVEDTPKEGAETSKETSQEIQQVAPPEAPRKKFSLDDTPYKFSWDTAAPSTPAPGEASGRSEFCTGIDTLIASSPDRFTAQRGDKTREQQGIRVYKSAFKLPGLTACAVLAYNEADGSAWITCGRKLPGDASEQAEKEAFSGAVQQVSGCLDTSVWKPSQDTWEASFERREPSSPKLEVEYKHSTHIVEVRVVSVQAKAFAGEAFCAALGQVVNSAGDNYKALRVESDAREQYTSNVTLPGTTGCTIEAPKRKPAEVTCVVTHTDDDRQSMELFKKGVEAVGSCLPPEQWKARVSRLGIATFTHPAPNAPQITVMRLDRSYVEKDVRDKLNMKQYSVTVSIGVPVPEGRK